MQDYKNLFLRQSYLDAYDTYTKTLNPKCDFAWDYVILTASNEAQADTCRMQLDSRIAGGRLSPHTHYAVIADPGGKRVGSGGATFCAMRYVLGHAGKQSFKGLRVMVIHSGGDSKRIPQYSACGKLFSPVPRMLPDGRRSTLFDEFVIGMSGVAARIAEGMLVCSGDVIMLFNPLQIDFFGDGATALSIKDSVDTGKNHGVYRIGSEGNVGRFLHKQTPKMLADAGAVDARGNVDIDTGAVIIGRKLLDDLYALVDTDEKFDRFVNDRARLSFYADFLYPLAEESTLEQFYREKPEGEFTEALRQCRSALWETIHRYRMKLTRLSPASFIHFGTTRELVRLLTKDMSAYRLLDWSARVNTNATGGGYAVNNGFISPGAQIADDCYIEDSYVEAGAVIEPGCVISGMRVRDVTIPAGSVVHGLKLRDGRYVVRIYGVADNPKEARLFGEAIDRPLWDMPLYPVRDSMEEALRASLDRAQDGELLSLYESYVRADVSAILAFEREVDERIKEERFLDTIRAGQCADRVREIYPGGISPEALSRLYRIAEALDVTRLDQFSLKMRIYYYAAALLDEDDWAHAYDRCFATVRDAVLRTVVGDNKYNKSYRIAKDEAVSLLPVRINWGGTWSDAPPYCLENGGTMLNAAVLLNGRKPIKVVAKRLAEKKVVLHSGDNGAYAEFTDMASLQNCQNPSDPFALHKAALIGCDVIPFSGDVPLERILDQIGGGIYLSTTVDNIPRGSGLGTSSILAGGCVIALFELFGVPIDEEELYNRVLCMEQVMSTGGGWQDQVGGLSPGIKLTTTKKGIRQQFHIVPLDIDRAVAEELEARFCLVYTGQRRLARNLLREIVGKCIGNEPEAMRTINEIQRLAVLMRFELERGNIDGFADLLSQHWRLSQVLDAGSTNTCIDQIFLAIEDMVAGQMICGAGGGGFLQVVLKQGVTKEALEKRLEDMFQDSGVCVWSINFYNGD